MPTVFWLLDDFLRHFVVLPRLNIYLRNAKKSPLGATFEGPYPIIKRLGDSCLQVQVGLFADGTPRYDTVHWNNAQPAVMRAGTKSANRPKLGRPKKNAANQQ